MLAALHESRLVPCVKLIRCNAPEKIGADFIQGDPTLVDPDKIQRAWEIPFSICTALVRMERIDGRFFVEEKTVYIIDQEWVMKDD